jgi:hypothetical protein
MPNYFSFAKQIKQQGKTFHFTGKVRRSKGAFYIDSTPLPACKNARYRSRKTFPNMAN